MYHKIKLLCLSIAILVVMSTMSIYAVENMTNYRVLVISSYDVSLPFTQDMIDGVRNVFPDGQAQVHYEFMDSKALTSDENLSYFSDYLRYKIENKTSYDLILAFDDNAVRFVEDYQATLFPDIPIVFAGLNGREYGREVSRNPLITGVIEEISVQETLDVILDLQPDAKTIYLLTDNTLSCQEDLKEIINIEFPLPFEVINFTEVPKNEYLSKIQEINANDAIIPMSLYLGYDDVYHDFFVSLNLLIENTQAPIYHFWKHGVGQGIVGGKVNSHFEQASVAAEIGLSILRGRDPASIALVEDSPNVFMFDYQVLAKHHLDIDKLPENSIIINKPYSLKEANPGLYWQIIFLITSLLLLIIILMIILLFRSSIIKRSRKANAFLSRVINGIQFPISIKDSNNRYVMTNEKFNHLFNDGNNDFVEEDFEKMFTSDVYMRIKNLDKIVEADGYAKGEIKLEKSNQIKVLSVIKSSFVDETGDRYIISSGNDITVLKEYEDELEAKVKERTNALKSANDALKRLTMVDQLTNIYNRRKLDEILNREMERYDRYQIEFSIIMVDIDHFKNVNDNFGHQVGDQVLRNISKLMRREIRATDIIGRWGGEEFLIVCANTNIEDAVYVADKLRKKIESKTLLKEMPITCSFGVNTIVDKTNITQLVKGADEALYKAKMNGRNQVCKYED